MEVGLAVRPICVIKLPFLIDLINFYLVGQPEAACK